MSTCQLAEGSTDFTHSPAEAALCAEELEMLVRVLINKWRRVKQTPSVLDYKDSLRMSSKQLTNEIKNQ